MADHWFRAAISDGLIYLMALNLPSPPQTETIELTKEAWIDTLWEGRQWVADDAPRIAAGFRALARNAERWPAPGLLLRHLPARAPAGLALPQFSPEQRRENLARMRAILQEAVSGCK